MHWPDENAPRQAFGAIGGHAERTKNAQSEIRAVEFTQETSCARQHDASAMGRLRRGKSTFK